MSQPDPPSDPHAWPPPGAQQAPPPHWGPAGWVPPQWQPPIPPPKRKPRIGRWIAGGIGAVVLLLSIAALASDPKPADSSAGPRAATGPSTVLGPAKTITAREWQLIAKNPDSHKGERVIVYGQVTQFDAATGTEGFRANIDAVEHKPDYGWADYDTNTILGGDEATLTDLVNGDLFKAEVTVAGAESYETVMGGNMTVPRLTVTKIDVIGHVGS